MRMDISEKASAGIRNLPFFFFFTGTRRNQSLEIKIFLSLELDMFLLCDVTHDCGIIKWVLKKPKDFRSGGPDAPYSPAPEGPWAKKPHGLFSPII